MQLRRISVRKYHTLLWGLSECGLPAACTKITAVWASEIAKEKKKKRKKSTALFAKDSIKEIWDNSLNTLHDCWAHWSRSRGAPSVVKMCLVPGGSLCLSHVTNISIAEYHKFVETKSQWLSFCTLFCPECHLSRWFMRWTLAMQVFFPSEWRNNPEKKRISFELIEEAALSLIH